MIDTKHAKAICDAYNATPAHAPTQRTDFATEAAVGWPAALEEIDRLREVLETVDEALATVGADDRYGANQIDKAQRLIRTTLYALGEGKE